MCLEQSCCDVRHCLWSAFSNCGDKTYALQDTQSAVKTALQSACPAYSGSPGPSTEKATEGWEIGTDGRLLAATCEGGHVQIHKVCFKSLV